MSRAFTLIELLVVTAIIALTVVFIFPNYRNGQHGLDLQISASKLSQNLRKAQEMAVSAKDFQGAPIDFRYGYGVYFDIVQPDRYILFADLDNDNNYDGSGEIVETAILEENAKIRSLSPAGPLTIIFYPPDPLVYFYPDAAAASITIEAEKLRGQASQYIYQRVWCQWWSEPCSGWLGPRAQLPNVAFNCDISSSSVDCPASFSAQVSEPSIVYDIYRWLGWWNYSYKYQKQESQVPTYVEKTVEINKAGLINVQ